MSLYLNKKACKNKKACICKNYENAGKAYIIGSISNRYAFCLHNARNAR